MALCTFLTDTNGNVDLSSVTPSPLLWAIGVLHKNAGAELSFDEYDRFVGALTDRMTEIYGTPLDAADAAAHLYGEITGLFGTDELYGGAESKCTYIYSRYSSEEERKNDCSPADRYLSGVSFYRDDIEMVAKAVRERGFGTHSVYERRVIDYILSGTDEAGEAKPERLAVTPDTADETERERIKIFFRETLDINNAPHGKWPSGYMPVLMQQMAINIASSDSPDAPAIFSVNGPPGSGKTAMLKELIADRMVKRAIMLAELERPDDLFTKYADGYYEVKPEYSGIHAYGLIAAAVSNNAAENISKEFPSVDFGDLTEDRAGYFRVLANKLLGCGENEKNQLLSAPLGSKKNLADFAKVVLAHPTFGQSDLSDFCEYRKKFMKQLETVRKMQKDMSGGKLPDDAVTLGDGFFEDWFSDSQNRRRRAECSCPYMTEAYDREREKLFYLACMLHRGFLFGSNGLRHDLGLLKDMWLPSADGESDRFAALRPAMKEILPTLFLLVPLISTTFASFGTFMKDITDSGVFGTLIVDEAGQAKPRFAVGALYRCRRALIVGDPRQIPPIADPNDSIIGRLLARERDIPENYRNGISSVQTFADGINPYGRYIGAKDEDKEWVGCPLIVHRRCEEPMFTIANSLSYDLTLIKVSSGGGKRGRNRYILPSSCLINVTDNDTRYSFGHYSYQQGQLAFRLLLEAFARRRDALPDVFIVSPYVSVVNGINGLIRRSVIFENADDLKKWYGENNIGTVHTFQGREADEVILVLGITENPGFVTNNIVNTAVTRAKRRLYVISDESQWKYSSSVQTMFDVMKDSRFDADEIYRKLTALHYKCPACGCELAGNVDLKGEYLTCVNKKGNCSEYHKPAARLAPNRLR